MKKILTIAGMLLVCAAPTCPAHGQATAPVVATPEYGGFSWPVTAGVLRYSVSGSQSIRSNYSGTGQKIYQTNLNGELGMTTSSVVHPFELRYTGGYLLASGSGETGYFQNMLVSQSYNLPRWKFQADDALSFTPAYDGIGPAGIAGGGNSGVPPPISSPGSLLSGGDRLTNNTSGRTELDVSGSTSVNGTGTYGIQRFRGESINHSLEDNSLTVGGGVSHRIDALNSATATYNYTNYKYLSSPQPLKVQVLEIGYSRIMSRRLHLSVAGGPERIGASSTTGAPATWNFDVDGDLQYTTESWTGELTYKRSTNEGSGLTLGSRTDRATGTASYRLSREWHVSADVTYLNSDGLRLLTNTPFSTRSESASVDLSRAFARYYSAYVSYADQHQTTEGQSQSSLAYSGNTQSLTFGISYTPRSINVGRK